MRLLILGATGQTGLQLVQQALDANHEVTALVRDPSKIDIQNDNLKVHTANIFDEEDMKLHVQGQDAVMSCLGFPLKKPVLGYKQATETVTNAMKATGVKRAVFMHSWYSEKVTRDNADSFIMRWVFLPLIIGSVLDGMREAEVYLEESCKELDYTVVLPGGLLNKPVTDKKFIMEPNVWAIPGISSRIPRADVARYMLSIAEDEASYRAIHCIATED